MMSPAAVAIWASVAVAQPVPVPPAPAPDEVVVTGRPLGTLTGADQVRSFAGAPPEVQLARWSDHVCPVVTGLNEVQNAHVAQAVAKVAGSFGVKAKVGGCTPNVIILITSRPPLVIEALLKQKARFFSRFIRDADVRKALGGDRPVRWMLGAETRSADGQYLQSYESGLGEPEYKEDHARNSRIAASLQQSLQAVIMVVDAGRIDGLPLTAVADYLAMAALAQVQPEQEFKGVDTVMNLFAADQGRAAQGLTPWDRRYLAGLYALDPSAKAGAQRSSLADRVSR